MFKYITFAALFAIATAAPGFIAQPVVAKVGTVVHSVPSATSHQSITQVHSNAHIVTPVVKTLAPVVHAASVVPVVKTYSAPVVPVVKTVAPVVPVVKTYSAPVVPVVKTVAPVVPVVKTYSAPLVHHFPVVKTFSAPVIRAAPVVPVVKTYSAPLVQHVPVVKSVVGPVVPVVKSIVPAPIAHIVHH